MEDKEKLSDYDKCIWTKVKIILIFAHALSCLKAYEMDILPGYWKGLMSGLFLEKVQEPVTGLSKQWTKVNIVMS